MTNDQELWEDIDEREILTGDQDDIPSRAKVWSIRILSILLIVLVLSWVFVMFPIRDILIGMHIGRVPTTQQSVYILQGDGITIEFTPQVYYQIQDIYAQYQKTEISICLSAQKTASVYTVTDWYMPTIIQSSFDSVTFERCDDTTSIYLHTHPYRRCAPSQTDKQTLQSIQEYKPHAIMLIMCEPNRFTIIQ